MRAVIGIYQSIAIEVGRRAGGGRHNSPKEPAMKLTNSTNSPMGYRAANAPIVPRPGALAVSGTSFVYTHNMDPTDWIVGGTGTRGTY